MRNMLRLILFFLAMLGATPAHAGTCGGLLNPILVLSLGVSFGNYSPSSGAATTTNGTLTVTCTVALLNELPSFTVALSNGLYGNFVDREMDFLGGRLKYNLYVDTPPAAVWGDGTGSTQTRSYNANENLGSKNFTIYGAIPSHQFPTAGLYLDTITVTVSF